MAATPESYNPYQSKQKFKLETKQTFGYSWQLPKKKKVDYVNNYLQVTNNRQNKNKNKTDMNGVQKKLEQEPQKLWCYVMKGKKKSSYTIA